MFALALTLRLRIPEALAKESEERFDDMRGVALFGVVIGALLVVGIFIFFGNRSYRKSVDGYKHFKVIGFEDSVDGGFQIYSIYKGYIFLVVNQEDKIAIGPTRHLNCSTDLKELISSSYTFHKRPFSDTIVFRNGKVECKYLLIE